MGKRSGEAQVHKVRLPQLRAALSFSNCPLEWRFSAGLENSIAVWSLSRGSALRMGHGLQAVGNAHAAFSYN